MAEGGAAGPGKVLPTVPARCAPPAFAGYFDGSWELPPGVPCGWITGMLLPDLGGVMTGMLLPDLGGGMTGMLLLPEGLRDPPAEGGGPPD